MNMARVGSRDDYLFSDGDLASGLRELQNRAHEHVDEIVEEEFIVADQEEFSIRLQRNAQIQPIELLPDGIKAEREETEAVTPRDYGLRPGRAKGHRFIYYIPFSGDPGLWQARPSTFSSMLPHGTVMPHKDNCGGVLNVTVEIPQGRDLSEVKQAFDKNYKLYRAVCRLAIPTSDPSQ